MTTQSPTIAHYRPLTIARPSPFPFTCVHPASILRRLPELRVAPQPTAVADLSPPPSHPPVASPQRGLHRNIHIICSLSPLYLSFYLFFPWPGGVWDNQCPIFALTQPHEYATFLVLYSCTVQCTSLHLMTLMTLNDTTVFVPPSAILSRIGT